MNRTRYGRSEGKRGGRKRAEEGGCNGASEMYREERVRKGDSERGKFQGMYPREDTSQYTVRIHCSKLPTTRPLPLRLFYYEWQIVSRYRYSVL